MKILLIRPKPSSDSIGLNSLIFFEPLELEYLVAYLEPRGHQVQIADMMLEKHSIVKIVQNYQPDLIGITGYLTHVGIIKNYAKQIKQQYNIPIAIGGVHAEVVPEDFLDDNIDYIIWSKGLETFAEIADSIEKDQPVNTPCVWGPGAVKPAFVKKIDYPYPNRKSTQEHRHKYNYLGHQPCGIIKISFGCPYNCSFCFCNKITQGNYFSRNVDDAIAELKTIPETHIFIVDDNFLVSREWLLEFCNKSQTNGLKKKYLIFGRADFIATNEDIIKQFQNIGLAGVFIGIESWREDELNQYNKKTTVSINETAIAILAKYDIELYAGFIASPDWQNSDFRDLATWTKKNKLKYIALQPLEPMPGTETLTQYKDNIITDRQDYAKWDFSHVIIAPQKMSVRQFYWQIVKFYYRTSAGPSFYIYLLKRHGLIVTWRTFKGSCYITYQYLKLIIKP